MDMEEKIINYLKFRKPDEWEMWLDVYKNEKNEKFNSDIRRKANLFCNPPKKNYLWLTLSPDKFLSFSACLCDDFISNTACTCK